MRVKQGVGHAPAREYPTVEDYVGQTPLVRLQRLNSNPSNVILCKLEGNNPAGSVKDRYEGFLVSVKPHTRFQ